MHSVCKWSDRVYWEREFCGSMDILFLPYAASTSSLCIASIDTHTKVFIVKLQISKLLLLSKIF